MSVAISTSNGTNKATLIEQYVSPDRQLDSSQGSHQFLPNGNHLLGLGSYPYIYEQTSSGTTVWYANWGPLPLQSYRAFKYPWIGKPLLSEIALFAYARNCSAPTAFYASWNGATQVKSWKYFTSSSVNGTFTLAATGANNGTFETFATGAFNLYVYAIAYDSVGNMLGQTPTITTFVPNAALAPKCNAISCPPGTSYSTLTGSKCSAPLATTKSPTVSSTSSKQSSSVSKTSTSAKTTTNSPARRSSLSSSPFASAPSKTPQNLKSTLPSSIPLKPQVSSKPTPSPSPPIRPVSRTNSLLKPQVTSKPTRSTSPIIRPKSTTKATPAKPQVTSKPTPNKTPPVRPKASTSTLPKFAKTPKHSYSKSHTKMPMASTTPSPSPSAATKHTKVPKTSAPHTSPIKRSATSTPSRSHTTPAKHVNTSKRSTPGTSPVIYPATSKPSPPQRAPIRHEKTSRSSMTHTSPVIYPVTCKRSSSSSATRKQRNPMPSFTKVRRPTSPISSPTPTLSARKRTLHSPE